MNKAMMSGNLATDPEITYTASGHQRCTFRLAVRRDRRGPDGRYEADFFTVVAWNKTAELCRKYLWKGRRCLICGPVETYTYKGQDGIRRSGVQVRADSVEFLDAAQSGAGNPPEEGGMEAQGFVPVDEEQLPF